MARPGRPSFPRGCLLVGVGRTPAYALDRAAPDPIQTSPARQRSLPFKLLCRGALVSYDAGCRARAFHDQLNRRRAAAAWCHLAELAKKLAERSRRRRCTHLRLGSDDRL
jgi:hypothetical protein